MRSQKTFFIIIIALASIAGAFSVYSHQSSYEKALLVFPKGGTYDKEWKKVDSLAKKGLNASALEVVKGIYDKAKASNNAPQLVKAIIHRMKFEDQADENAPEHSISRLEEEVKDASYPVKPVLRSMLAESYWNYYTRNRWQYANRSTTAPGFKNDDISTWDLRTIFEHVVKNYQASLENTDSLRRTPLDIYDDILVIKQPDTRKFRPTLYDFLAHRAVDFYMNSEPDIIRPAHKFELNSESYFWSYPDFVKLKISSEDTLSTGYYAISILQQLTAFHQHDKDPQALIDVELKRLRFVKEASGSEIKDSLYLAALQNLQEQYDSDPASADISYDIASACIVKAGRYAPLQSEENKWFNKQALAVCEAAVKKFPGSSGAKNCAVLKASVLAHSLDVYVEKAVLPDQPSRALVSYKNLNTLYVRIARLDIDKYNKAEERYYGEELLKKYREQSPVKEFSVTLPDDGDYQLHRTEIKIPSLPAGHYIILTSPDKDFAYKKNETACSPFWVSTISYLTRRMPDGSYDFYVQHRGTGAPLKNVIAQLYYYKYNYLSRKDDYVKGPGFTTDENGFFNVPVPPEYRNYLVDLSYVPVSEGKSGRDCLQTDDALYMYKSEQEDAGKHPHTLFFTDRAIYRPGQTVYFKGIMISTDDKTNTILPNTPTTVTFYDVNDQEIAKLDLRTNEYGSFSGSFTAPAGTLTGDMRIENGSGAITISVEEYKRPKFDVSFNPVEGNYRLDENVKVTGIAKAYSGASIDGAAVKYRVVRNASFPYWFYYRKGYYPQSAEAEITNGTTTSNDTGAFFIDFKALPDPTIPRADQPDYTYTVYADVTDLNGETHSSETSVVAAYTALRLNVRIPSMLEKENKDAFAVSTTNMNGGFQAAQGKIEIYKLKEPSKTYRERAWERPDKYIISRADFEKDFPEDEYKDENNMYKWERGEKVFEKNFSNRIGTSSLRNGAQITDSVLINNLSGWKQGIYVMEARSTDAYGEEVKDVKYFTVYSNAAAEVPSNNIDWFSRPAGRPAEPGEKAMFVIGSKENVNVLFEVESRDHIIRKEIIKLNNEQKKIEIPVEESYRGNFTFHCTFIKNNRVYIHSATVTVPYSDKELDLQFESFRNKLIPGQKEEWKIKISDKAGDKIAAEMMATLYDASLDAFRPHYWNMDIYNQYYSSLSWESGNSFGRQNAQLLGTGWNVYPPAAVRIYDRLNWFGYVNGMNLRGNIYSYKNINIRGARMDDEVTDDSTPLEEVVSYTSPAAGTEREKKAELTAAGLPAQYGEAAGEALSLNANAAYSWGFSGDGRAESDKDERPAPDLSVVAARSNFAETAFFYPALETDKDGNVIISFTIPEALTKWKMLGLAHTKDLKYGTVEKELVTQKQLMVIPDAPRFFRESDRMEFTSKISNLSDAALSGTAQIWFYDATTMKDITAQLLGTGEDSQPKFTVKKGQSTLVSWNIRIPEGFGAISYKVAAKAGDYTDAEEMAIPVLTNRMLVTETLPLPVRGSRVKTFRFEKLISQNGSLATLRNHKLTLEYTSNPAWYAVQALPYLMEYPYECAEQTFSRFYANSIAAHIANSSPKIKAVFDSWKSQSPDALLSNLEKNQELKSLMLEETPWVLDAKNESERKKRVALLFDLNRMDAELGSALKKLQKLQTPNGGFPWFEGMRDDRFITQYIATGMGHLDRLGIKKVREDAGVWNMVQKGIRYLDDRIREDYENVLRYDKAHPDDDHLGYEQIQYLYARSYFKDLKANSRNQKAIDYYLGQEKKYWLKQNRYMQGMIALALNRYDEKSAAMGIIRSLKENAISSDEMGMYWKENDDGFYWYQAPVEAQALMIEAFSDVAGDRESVENMKVWLLRSKQTQDWKTTKATAEAVYALLMEGTGWLSAESSVEISLGDLKVDPEKWPDVKAEAGTGYFKTSWSGTEIKPEMGNITVSKKGEGPAWGAVYWQYFEQLDKITTSKTPLALKKQLFIERNTADGPVLDPLTEKTAIQVGDKIKVRIELRVDRDMEYVQMKDMRASAFEPVNVFSGYRWQDGLGYYESTRDAATNFFFDKLPKGTYVFEYPVTVTHNGDFSNGITSVQCMYAPEFTSNSEGIRVKVGR